MDKNELSNVNVGYPRFCDMVIATRCILRCKMCKAWQGGVDSREISFEEAKRFVRSLSEFVKFPLEINIMGGEPLLKDWCLDLCKFIHEQGFRSIISTNACLIDEDMAKRIADSKLSVLAISLESLKASTHDFYRGVEGTFSKVMNAIKYLEKYCKGRLTITILTIIMEKNLDDILELVEWVNSNNLFENISFLALLETGLVHPRQDWFKKPEYEQLWPEDVAKTHRLIDELIRLRKKGYRIWNPVSQLEAFKAYYSDPEKFMQETEYRIHDYIIDLDENGTIYLSGEPLGNIKEDNIGQLWFSEKANQIRNKIARYGPGKRCCVINFVCAFPSDEEYALKKPIKNIQPQQEESVLSANSPNQDLLRDQRQQDYPDFCVIEVSHKCLFRCKMCNYWKSKDGSEEMNTEDLYKFISSLKAFVRMPFEMNISGGEPLLKDGAMDLVEFIAQRGFRFSLVTNGYLINGAIAKRIANSGLNFLAISLDSLDEKTHDYLRGKKGAHNKVMEAIEYFINYRGRLQNLVIQTIIMEPNSDNILDLVYWVEKKGLAISFMAITRPNMIPMDPVWYKKREFSFLWPKDTTKLQYIIDTLIKLKNSGYRIDNPVAQLERFKLYFLNPERFVRETPCSLGDKFILINPKGDIYLCCEMDSVGNIKEGDIARVWTSLRARNIREKIRLCKRNCAEMVNCYRES